MKLKEKERLKRYSRKFFEEGIKDINKMPLKDLRHLTKDLKEIKKRDKDIEQLKKDVRQLMNRMKGGTR